MNFSHFTARLSEFLPDATAWLFASEIYSLWLLGRDERQVAAEVKAIRRREKADNAAHRHNLP